MKKFRLLLLPVAVLLLSPLAVFADDMKIAVVDLQEILQQAPQVTSANQSLKKEFAPQEQKIVAQQKQIQADQDKLQANASSMSEAERIKLQKQVTSEKDQLTKDFTNFRQALIAAHDKEMQTVITQVNNTIEAVAKEQKISLVLQKQSVLYSDQQFDLTSQVLTSLSKQAK